MRHWAARVPQRPTPSLAARGPRPLRRLAAPGLPRRRDARRGQDDVRADGAADRPRAASRRRSWSSRRRRTSRSSGRRPRPGSSSTSTRPGRPPTGRCPPDMHGVVTSYQQVAISAAALRPLARRAVVVLDEVHHAGEEQAWGESLRIAFGESARRLSLSGTPFRSDTRAIPFVRYEADEAVPDFEYGYGDALRDGRVVRPVYFPRTGGEMEWSAPGRQRPRGDVRRPARHAARQPAAADGAVDRRRVAARGPARGRRPPDRGPPPAAGGRRPRHRDRPGARAGDRGDAPARLRAAGVDRDLGRPGGIGPDRRVRRRAATRGWSPSGWSARAWTSRGCASASTPRRRRPTCSSARRWAGSSAGRPASATSARGCTSRTTSRLRIRAAEIAEARRHSLRRTPRDGDADELPRTGPDDAADAGRPAVDVRRALGGGGRRATARSPWHEPLPDWDGEDGGIEIELGPPPPVAAMELGRVAGDDAPRGEGPAAARRTPRRPRTSPG